MSSFLNKSIHEHLGETPSKILIIYFLKKKIHLALVEFPKILYRNQSLTKYLENLPHANFSIYKIREIFDGVTNSTQLGSDLFSMARPIEMIIIIRGLEL